MKRTITFLFSLAFFLCMFPWDTASAFGWGYQKNNNHTPPEIGAYQAVLDKYNAFYIDDSGEKNLYLTFDNGYEQGFTSEILDVLKKEAVPATFFVTGHYVESEPELVKRMVDDGHIIGNHSYHHPDFTVMDKEAIKLELEELEQAVAEVSDQEELIYVRPPRGTFSADTLKWSTELGLVHVFWSLAFKDWETDSQKGADYAYDEIMKQIHPGAIILLHAVSSDNATALEKVIQDLKKEGYQFKSLDDLWMHKQLPKQFLY
ncbi:delta-lactam-biosynthetic de-N-acetylase [Oceanobacillus sp. J11TS1]|uniref:delta-lactam-biosynthetic de-N-acetylase n=1 Tax=Oceanobacillus sp. J11TS1 TaxID=2807191 RepID=UPI001B1F5F51|nr:delta-lactam-biosynthetic de-N-acetylase [Oceanobacillus sp. J11TS1]GIO24904.1 peptidoglycan-N-acetylmuramic acid deacetylase PdaA [Oceanobacillus sp. J11TS1]